MESSFQRIQSEEKLLNKKSRLNRLFNRTLRCGSEGPPCNTIRHPGERCLSRLQITIPTSTAGFRHLASPIVVFTFFVIKVEVEVFIFFFFVLWTEPVVQILHGLNVQVKHRSLREVRTPFAHWFATLQKSQEIVFNRIPFEILWLVVIDQLQIGPTPQKVASRHFDRTRPVHRNHPL